MAPATAATIAAQPKIFQLEASPFFLAKKAHTKGTTAKSHIAHIYQKTGLNSQQHLMDLIEDYMSDK